MFSTSEVGKKIAAYRKERNMTQMELADNLGVSYQAVSNWERGNSMPDIAKLPELVSILGCSIDELLGNRKESELFKKVLEGDAKEYVKEQKVSVEELASAAPALKPSQTESLVETVLDENSDRISLEDLVKIAPFVSEEFLMEWINRIDIVENIKGVTALAPFLEEKSLDVLVKKITKVGELSQISSLAPFLSEESLDTLVEKAFEEGKIGECTGLYPFLSSQAAKKLADLFMKNGNMKEFVKLAPFL
ncbi:helix-turn-helix domain-containing protein [Anaerocolumna sp. AGMB13020]|uniref:helix-turn-helix domain-containing protein n=1 Tax=Anaerocolumna sp. AGMB13020 TaxID=3081750 RepID=UPI002952C1F5|nr:helix-turn-helix domain-containing protein [Anaerocolumna sp. AGMB13020]WOO38027.1 helix-turn-helix domain-containing protein [Anaerocolumna sp. AGMB13020]